MSISVGFTAEEIHEFVLEYQALPQGQKGLWLSTRGVAYERLRGGVRRYSRAISTVG